MKLRSYQSKLKREVLEAFKDNATVVLAAAPSSGKTITAISIASTFKRTLILASGYSLIRDQWSENLAKKNSHTIMARQEEMDFSKFKYIVSLPQTMKNWLGHISNIDLLVLDEAHLRFFGKEMKLILKAISPKKVLLLTGTPSIFIGKKDFKIVGISPEKLFDLDVISNPKIELHSGEFNIWRNDIDENGDLIEFADINSEHLSSAVAGLVKKIPKSQKTMVVMPWQKEATILHKYLAHLGIESLLSISDIKRSEKRFDDFKKPEHNLIIVVNRGILGFDYPELVNVIDASFNFNVDRNFQIVCRLIRKSEDAKRYIRLTTEDLSLNSKFQMMLVSALCSEEYYFSRTKDFSNFTRQGSHHLSRKDLDAMLKMNFTDFMNLKDMIKNMEFKVYLKQEMRKYSKIVHCVESALEMAKNCSSRIEFKKKHKGAYNFLSESKNMHLLAEVLPRKPFRAWQSYSIEENLKVLLEESKKYFSRSAFRVKNSGGHDWAKQNGLLSKLKFKVSHQKYTPSMAIKLAKNFYSLTDMKRYQPGLQEYIRRNKIEVKFKKRVGLWKKE